MSYCLVIPHFNHVRQFTEFFPVVLESGLPCIIVDDGSASDQLEAVEAFLQGNPNVYLCKHHYNRGKGAAVKTALNYARVQGFTHAIQIDADGQHNSHDIGRFVQISKNWPSAIICGRPVFDESVPKIRLYGRKITDFWVALETLSLEIKDGLCGFRVYPLMQTELILDRYYVGSRMDFDTELLVKAVWRGVTLKFIDTQVIYPAINVSHFRYWRDNAVLIRLHTRLMLGMLLRLPCLVYLALQRNKSGSSAKELND